MNEEIRARLAARAAMGPAGMAGDFAAMATLQGEDPAVEIRQRIVGSRTDAYMVNNRETVYTPTKALEAKIAAMNPGLQGFARILAAKGFDACQALEDAAEEGRQQGAAMVAAESTTVPAASALTASDIAALKKAGLTDEEIRKFA
ncbi:MAG: hypothetical protein AB7T74_03035 [Clostridia bacterium]